ncbi:MAG TPA: PRC-barrel domain-containing protein [Longimicrobiales bacterium]|nr:PRC-barrel domain-containing protein [Longimicrobiales bacterium]
MDESPRIVPLDELPDFRVAEGQSDVAGWTVIAADGERVGKVVRMLVDVSARKVRYLDVALHPGALPMGAEKPHEHRVLIPIGYARLNRRERWVVVEGLRGDDVANLPPFELTRVSREYEIELRRWLDEDFVVEPVLEDGFYDHGMFNDHTLRHRGD